MRAILSVLPFFALLPGCTSTPGSAASIPPAAPTSKQAFKVTPVATGLDVPWAIAFLPDGDILFTERLGRVRLIKGGKLQEDPVLELTEVVVRGEGGLMDITLHPDFTKNSWLYLSYVTGGPQVVVIRYKYENGRIGKPTKIIEGIGARVNHAGCRVRFGPDGKLYITTGEGFQRERAQDLKDLGGKTLRLNDDGSIPKDNPFVGKADARAEIWSYGHRNAQGIAWDPKSGLQWQSEHGPSGEKGRDGDEINIVEKGKNYGWPLISHDETGEGLVSPVVQYTPALAPGDAMFCSGKMFPEWKGNLFVTGLRGERLVRLATDGRKITSQENLFEDTYGRLRTIAEAPDGSLYVLTSNQDGRGQVRAGDDKILRIYK